MNIFPRTEGTSTDWQDVDSNVKPLEEITKSQTPSGMDPTYLKYLDGVVKNVDQKFLTLEQEIKKTGEQLVNLSSEIGTGVNDTKAVLGVVKKETNEMRKDIFSVMAMFFTIFAFVSFSIQIFSRIEDVIQIAIILSVIMTMTFSVVSFFIGVIYKEKNNYGSWAILGVFVSVIIIVIFIVISDFFNIDLDKSQKPPVFPLTVEVRN